MLCWPLFYPGKWISEGKVFGLLSNVTLDKKNLFITKSVVQNPHNNSLNFLG